MVHGVDWVTPFVWAAAAAGIAIVMKLIPWVTISGIEDIVDKVITKHLHRLDGKLDGHFRDDIARFSAMEQKLDDNRRDRQKENDEIWRAIRAQRGGK